MNQETKNCQSCHQAFTIESEDFDFYKKIDVPAPTWCPECRMKRRMLFRNEFNMHKFQCGLCGIQGISHYSKSVKFPVYCNECWWSDKWDPLDYGLEYNSNKTFFSQWKELSDVMPRPSLEAYQNENSPYSDFTWFSKNVYLSPSTLNSDTVSYSKGAWSCRETLDSIVIMNSESVYEAMDSERCVKCVFISDCKDCMNSSYLYDCRNSSDCFMSSNLRNGKFVFRNQQLAEEEYRKRLEAISSDYSTQRELRMEYVRMKEAAFHKYANIIKCVGSSGDNLVNCKNAKHSFNSADCEDIKYCAQASHAKDSYDMYGVGDKECSLLYEGVNVGYLDSNIYFSLNTFESSARIQYCDYCRVSQDLFGCVGLRKKQYCILNKQYGKDEYLELRASIVEGMSNNPYVGLNGQVYPYGEFFPVELSPFAYNESLTQFYFPLHKDEALAFGCRWAEPEPREYQSTKTSSDLPATIKEANDDILSEVIECEHRQGCIHNCTLAFKTTQQEFGFYRKMDLPIPRLCPGCRRGERMDLHKPLRLWRRRCMCKKGHDHENAPCPSEFETSYAPDRPEIVYCEQCYNAEVA
ncbi:MAG: hypothetical protein AAB495_03005 [Patescibacteria group bacterium]